MAFFIPWVLPVYSSLKLLRHQSESVNQPQFTLKKGMLNFASSFTLDLPRPHKLEVQEKPVHYLKDPTVC